MYKELLEDRINYHTKMSNLYKSDYIMERQFGEREVVDILTKILERGGISEKE